MGEKIKGIKNENKVLIMLAFFSIAVGVWQNFRQLWLQENGFEVDEISKVLSMGTLVCAISLIVITKYVTMSKIKDFLSLCVGIKVINTILMYITNGCNKEILISMLTIIDILTEKLIIINIYPLILTMKKDDVFYSKRKLVEYLFNDIGILVAGLIIGKTIFNVFVNYNFLLLVVFVFLIISFIILIRIKVEYTENEKKDILKSIIELFKDEIFRTYMIFIFVSHVAMGTGLGLKMLMLTNLLDFSASGATNYLLIVGLIADLIGILAVKHLTPKNDYITVTIKFGIRFTLYLITFFTNSLLIAIVAITFSILISTAYENVVDAPFINRIKNENQLTFNTIRYVVTLVADSVGLYYAGLTYNYGIGLMLGMSAFFMIFQIGFAYKLVYMKKQEAP